VSYQHWASEHPKLSKELPTVKTSRGMHVYARSVNGFHDFGNGEYRGDRKHYVVVPPSQHPAGGRYRWVIPPGKVIPRIEDPVEAGLAPHHFLPSKEEMYNSIHNLHTHKTAGSARSAESAGYNPIPPSNILDKTILRLIQQHQPKRQGERNRTLFRLAQAIKGVSTQMDTEQLAAIFGIWWQSARTVVGTKDEELSFGELIVAYVNCRFPGGVNWDTILHEANEEPLPHKAKVYPPRLQRLTRICAYLQRLNGERGFYLSYELAGRLIEVSKQTAQVLIRVLMLDGLLLRLEVGSQVTGKASVYRYVETVMDATLGR
jgi:hypothetical protein